MKRVLFAPTLGLALATVTGCFEKVDASAASDGGTGESSTDSATSAGTDATDSTSGTTSAGTASGTTLEPTTTASTTSTGDCSAADGQPDPACPSNAAFCVAGTCAGCDDSAVSPTACSDLDPATGVCAGDGRCVECVAGVDNSACGGSRPICSADNVCVGCTDNSQCSSGACIAETGECLLTEVTVQGTALRYDQIDPQPQADVTVQFSNVENTPSSNATGADGRWTIAGIPPGTLLAIEVNWPQTTPVFVPPQVRPRAAARLGNTTPFEVDVPVVPYAWMAKVAFECGIFASLEEATGTAAVNVYYTQRSTLFGRLVDGQGQGVSGVTKSAIQVDLEGFVNRHQNVADTDPNPAFVCFLEEDPGSGTYKGTTSATSSESGRFVMFRLSNPDSRGDGTATVTASGFDSQNVNFKSAGNIGVIELIRNDTPIVRDFERDVYPMFTQFACVGCHTNGGPSDGMGGVLGTRGGFAADWNLPPQDVFDNLVGPGTTCPDPMNPVRVCTDDPAVSLLIRRPLIEEPGDPPDPHPASIFPALDDPNLQIIYQWIEQGAERGGATEVVDFVQDIYPIFTRYGCVGCHTNGGPTDGMGGVLGTNDGFAADWNLPPSDVYMNLVGPGTTCPNPADPERICIDDPELSLLVTRPLTDPPGMDDPHPVDIFQSSSDPDLALIIEWIRQGAAGPL
jgi:hypothetical protein